MSLCHHVLYYYWPSHGNLCGKHLRGSGKVDNRGKKWSILHVFVHPSFPLPLPCSILAMDAHSSWQGEFQQVSRWGCCCMMLTDQHKDEQRQQCIYLKKYKVYNTLCPANSYNANPGRTFVTFWHLCLNSSLIHGSVFCLWLTYQKGEFQSGSVIFLGCLYGSWYVCPERKKSSCYTGRLWNGSDKGRPPVQ